MLFLRVIAIGVFGLSLQIGDAADASQRGAAARH